MNVTQAIQFLNKMDQETNISIDLKISFSKTYPDKSIYVKKQVEKVEKVVCEIFEINTEDLMIKTNKHKISHPRYIIMNILYFLNIGLKTVDIAGKYGLSHSSVFTANKQVRDWEKYDFDIQEKLKQIDLKHKKR